MNEEYSNPYDFTRPIKGRNRFAGREKELEEIDHYLSLASSTTPSFHNLSLVGQRAAGKTSLLNMLYDIAEEKGLLSVKVSLNNESATNDALLFKEVFGGLLVNGSKKEMFGGVKGTIYKSFRKIVDSFNAEVEIPFLFGTAYLGLKDNPNHSISQQVLISDFKKFYEEAKTKGFSAIVLLFDECDLFTKNETILQKFRNVFENLDGFVLVFSGTEEMFPNMEKVFSPIPRFFKRINVENFKDRKETEECLTKPLSEDEKKSFDFSCIDDIHAITNGSPYEINLIAHHMYRRWIEKKSKLIGLSPQILEDVLNEIERLRGAHYETVTNIKKCWIDQLQILIGLLEFPSIPTDWLAEFLLLNQIETLQENQINSKKSSIIANIKQLTKEDLVEEKDHNLQFKGDNFDILFLKYFCASKGFIDLKQLGFPTHDEPILNLSHKLTQGILLRDFQNYRVHSEFDKLSKQGRLVREISLGLHWKLPPGEHTMTIFANPETQNEFYLGVPNSTRFRTNVKWMNRGFVTQVRFENSETLDKFTNRLDILSKKLKHLGYDIILKDEIHWNIEGTELIKKGDFKKAIACFNKANSLNPIFELPWMNKARAYLNLEKYQQALNSINKAIELDPTLYELFSLKGWMLHKLQKDKEATATFERALEMNKEGIAPLLNFANMLFDLKKFKQAKEKYDHVLELQNNDTALYYQGICFSKLGNEKAAIENFDLILKNNPNDSHTLLQKAISLYEQKIFGQSLNILEKIEKDWEKNASYLEFRSLALYELNRMDEAINWINSLIIMKPDHGGAWFNRACFYARKKMNKKAISDLKKSIKLEPKYRNLAKKEKDFSKIKDLIEFKQVLKN